MSAEYIFRRVAQKIGQKVSDETERQIVADWVNEAVKAIYAESEIPELVKELSGDNAVQATPEGVLVLPRSVGKIRAMREAEGRWPWTLRDSYIKYKKGEQQQGLWFEWQKRGTEPLAVSSFAAGVPSAVVTTIDADLEVTITGTTADADTVSETVTMSALTVAFTKTFTKYIAITKNKATASNVTIKIGANIIAVIPNNMLESAYQHVDVSKYPSADSTGYIRMEVLYKELCPYLYNDGDVFADNKYDDVIIARAVGLWCEDNDRVEEAILRDRKASRELARVNDDEQRGQVRTAKFEPHPHDGLIPRTVAYRNRTLYRRR